MAQVNLWYLSGCRTCFGCFFPSKVVSEGLNSWYFGSPMCKLKVWKINLQLEMLSISSGPKCTHHSCQKVWLAELRMLDGSLAKPWNDLLKILSFTFIATVIKWMLMVNESCLAKMQQIMVWTWHLIFFLKLAILIFHLYSMRLILRILQNLRTSWEFGLQLRRTNEALSNVPTRRGRMEWDSFQWCSVTAQ